MSTESVFVGIAVSFEMNILSLRVLNEQIGGLAEQYDQTTVKEFGAALTEWFGPNRDEEKTGEIIEQPELSTEESFSDTESHRIGKEDEPEETEDALARKIESQLKDSEKVISLFRIFRSILKGLPVQEQLLRRSALTTLISYFEALLSDLIREFYLQHPSALPSDTRMLSLADLREIGSIEEAERYLTTKEVDSVLRESLKEQLDYLSKRLKVNIRPLDDYLEDLVEVTQRRNLFVHNNGIVNRIYLTQVSEDYIKQNDIKEGQQLVVNSEYLANAIDLVFLCGVILLQQCWRKWEKGSLEEADSVISSRAIYESLVDERYELTKKLAWFASTLDFANDRTSRVVTINHAIALKELNEIEEMEKLLSQRDWSSCSIEFHAALHALRNEEDALLEILPKAIAVEAIKRHDLQEWPVFKHFRNSSAFPELLERHFPSTSDATQSVRSDNH